jgi:hypothetical protein
MIGIGRDPSVDIVMALPDFGLPVSNRSVLLRHDLSALQALAYIDFVFPSGLIMGLAHRYHLKSGLPLRLLYRAQ